MQACATFTVDSGAATGPVSVTLSLDGVQSNAVQFYIQPAPSLTSILQSSETQGSVCDVTLIGENLLLAVINAPTGVTVSYAVATATQVAATFIIAADAPTGAQNVSVTTPSGTSGNVTFTVT